MDGTVANAENPATKDTPAGESEKTSTLASESNPHEWFYLTAQDELGKDAGLALAKITGYPESSCYAYVAHDKTRRRRPPEHFIRAVIHSEYGEPFHDAFMAGCAAGWWRDRQIRQVQSLEHARALVRLLE
jgi:hypothetical protein